MRCSHSLAISLFPLLDSGNRCRRWRRCHSPKSRRPYRRSGKSFLHPMHHARSMSTPSPWSWHVRRSIRQTARIAGASMWPPPMCIIWWKAIRIRVIYAPKCTRIIWIVRARRSSPYRICLGWNVEIRFARCRSLRSALAPHESFTPRRRRGRFLSGLDPSRSRHICVRVRVRVRVSVCMCVCEHLLRYIQDCYLFNIITIYYVCIFIYMYYI